VLAAAALVGLYKVLLVMLTVAAKQSVPATIDSTLVAAASNITPM
jgi:hypothetical protein